jgi:hypothetical protein
MKSKRFWKRMALASILIPTVLFFSIVLIVYIKQDAIVQDLMKDLNKDFAGYAEIKDSHISMFENFPYISIDLEEFKVYESKKKVNKPLINVHDAYIGFNLWTVLTGKMEIKKIKLKDGHIDLVQHENGEFNIVKALTSEKEIESPEEEFHLDLKKIELEDIDLTKLNEANGLKIEAFIEDANSKFRTAEDHVMAGVDANFVLNIIKNGDTTFLKHKHIDLDTEVDFVKVKDVMTIEPTTVHIEGAEFKMNGSVDFLNDVFLDLNFSGNKPNFDLFIAMAPEDMIPTLRQFENKGDIYLNTIIKGKSINGHQPAINAQFGCKNGYFKNKKSKKKVSGINFDAYFTNGKDHKVTSMEFGFRNFSAKPASGKIKGDIIVKNFKAPEVDIQFNSAIDMGFVSRFLELEHVDNLKGKAKIDIDYKDIIDIEHPERALEEMSESYKMNIELKDLSFSTDSYHLPVKDFDLITKVSGHQASILKCDLKVGKSDLKIHGTIDDLPAIIHHTDIPVDTRLKISSKYLDLFQLTGSDSTSIDEQIQNLSMDFDFKASARSFTESKYLPEGEFFIENFYAKLKHYPHTLHDFHADILVDERDLRLVDFKGMIDKSDFLFTGKLEHYEKWFDEHPGGDSKIEFNLVSNILQLESLFTYKGANYVPEEYRHEEFDDLKVHGFTYLHYADELKSMDLNIDKFEGKMKVHPLRFENFEGRIHYEDEHLVVEDFHGKLGKSQFKTTLHYYLGDNDKIRKRDNHFSLTASRLDVDQLIKYNPAPAIKKNKQIIKGQTVDHDAGFNIYELPFTDMTYEINIDHFNYHRYLMHNLKGKFHTTPEHYIYIDDFKVDAAGGHFDIKGYFNGSNPDLIYFSPDIDVYNVDLDKLMFKFENFGQDYLVSDNLHGQFTGNISGKVHMHNDLIPKIDDSEIHMDLDVTHGRLENYSMLEYMSDYFKDKNLNEVLFDTLNNHIDLVNGVMTIPAMTINSSLGHMEISGQQDLEGNMEYYLRIPWKMVTKTAGSKLFGKKKEGAVSANQSDEIQYGTSKTKYVNIIIKADDNGYSFSLGKPKDRRKKKKK